MIVNNLNIVGSVTIAQTIVRLAAGAAERTGWNAAIVSCRITHRDRNQLMIRRPKGWRIDGKRPYGRSSSIVDGYVKRATVFGLAGALDQRRSHREEGTRRMVASHRAADAGGRSRVVNYCAALARIAALG